jgi:hypothetical protein
MPTGKVKIVGPKKYETKIIIFHHCENRHCRSCHFMKTYLERISDFLIEHGIRIHHQITSSTNDHIPTVINHLGEVLHNHHDIHYKLVMTLLP